MLEKSLDFLTLIKENNYKEWFHGNKPLYEEAKNEFEKFVHSLIAEIHLFDNGIGYPEPKDCIFRIFRDIRFSHDKTPYKTNFGVYLAKGGNRKSEYGGYYFHLEPGNCLLAGGIWLPQPAILKAVREEIFHNIDEFLSIINNPGFKKHFDGIDYEYVLKKAPKDYPKDWPHIDFLKFKSFTISKGISEEMVRTGKGLLTETHEVFEAMNPLNSFFNRVIEDLR